MTKLNSLMIGLTISLAPLLITPLQAKQAPLILQAKVPATQWDHGYGVGNGRVAGLSFGNYPKETIVLNEGSIYSKNILDPKPNIDKAIRKARELCKDGKYHEADNVFRKDILLNYIPSNYQQGGKLSIEYINAPKQTGTLRTLNMREGRATTQITTEHGTLTTELWASPQADCVITEFTSTLSGDNSNFKYKINLAHPKSKSIYDEKSHEFILTGQGDNNGTKFENRTRFILPDKASVTSTTDGILISNVDHFFVISSITTDYNFKEPLTPLHINLSEKNKKLLAKAEKIGVKKLKLKASQYFSNLMDRCTLDIGDSPIDVQALTTPERVKRMKTGAKDPDLVEQLFQFGRYCTIVNSRPGSLPCGLQGLWNPDLNAAWGGCYFLNINVQMNYWPSLMTGLPEYHHVFTDFVLRLQKGGESFAKSLGYDGFCHGHNTDCWGKTYFKGKCDPTWGASLMNGAWACAHLIEQYNYTGDKEYLKKCLPLIESNARFILSWFEKDPKTGEYISGPATSPENGFYVRDSQNKRIECHVSNGNSHDLLLGREALRNYIFACKELNVNRPFLDQAKETYAHIPLPKIGKDGRLQEWQQEFEEWQPGHRHVSHCYGLFPGNEFDYIHTPQYVDAVKKSLDYRLAHGGGATGWSEAWLVNMYAVLHDGNESYARVNRLLANRINPNLFDLHPPFQIDGNFGVTAGIAQCLVQSQITQNDQRIIQITPALPDAWIKGSATGLSTRGGLTIDLTWDNGKVNVKATASRKGNFRFVCQDQHKDISLKKGETYTTTFQK